MEMACGKFFLNSRAMSKYEKKCEGNFICNSYASRGRILVMSVSPFVTKQKDLFALVKFVYAQSLKSPMISLNYQAPSNLFKVSLFLENVSGVTVKSSPFTIFYLVSVMICFFTSYTHQFNSTTLPSTSAVPSLSSLSQLLSLSTVGSSLPATQLFSLAESRITPQLTITKQSKPWFIFFPSGLLSLSFCTKSQIFKFFNFPPSLSYKVKSFPSFD